MKFLALCGFLCAAFTHVAFFHRQTNVTINLSIWGRYLNSPSLHHGNSFPWKFNLWVSPWQLIVGSAFHGCWGSGRNRRCQTTTVPTQGMWSPWLPKTILRPILYAVHYSHKRQLRQGKTALEFLTQCTLAVLSPGSYSLIKFFFRVCCCEGGGGGNLVSFTLQLFVLLRLLQHKQCYRIVPVI